MSVRKYDWDRLKMEFFAGDFFSVSDFLRSKNMPTSETAGSVQRATAGWSEEKRKLKQQSVEKSAKRMFLGEYEQLEEVRLRQARLARYLQIKGASKLKTLEPQTVDEARRLIVSGIEQERKSLETDRGQGRPSSLTQVNIGTVNTTFDKMVENLNYEQLLEFIAELKRERIGRTVSSLDTGSQQKVEDGEIK